MRDDLQAQSSSNPASTPNPALLITNPAPPISGSTSGLQGLQGLQGLNLYLGQNLEGGRNVKNQGRGTNPQNPANPAGVLTQLAEQLGQMEPHRLAVVISLLPVEQMLAVRIGADIALERADHQLAELLRVDYADGRYHRTHPLPEFTELQRRRYPPTGDRDPWIRYGPTGPPATSRGTA